MADQEEQDRMLPIANVGRVMKQILPPAAKISKEAKQTVQECATEFISFVTGEASNKCHKENRKTVNGDDICWALSSLGFDNYAEAMLSYLLKFREAERDKLANQISKGNNNNNNNTSPNNSTNSNAHEECKDFGDQVLDYSKSTTTTTIGQPDMGEEKSTEIISTAGKSPTLMEFKIIDQNNMGDHHKSLVESS